jgi:hypothetical protein
MGIQCADDHGQAPRDSVANKAFGADASSYSHIDGKDIKWVTQGKHDNALSKLK